MAKIQFRIRDKEKNVIAGVRLLITCKLRSGEPWRSDQLTADNAGVIWLEIPNPLMRQIDWQTMRLDIRHKGQKLEAKHERPERINRDGFQVMVTVRRPVADPDPVKEPEPDPSPEPIAEPKDEILVPRPERDKEPQTPPAKEEDPPVYEVLGKILTANGRPDPGRTVVAFDRDIGDEAILGQITSDKEGAYHITYSPDQFVDKKRRQANLIVRVFAAADTKADSLARSPLIVRAALSERVNLSTSGEEYRGLSSYEKIGRALRPLLKNREWSSLQPEDIWLLADRTGLPAASIAQFIRAWQLAAHFGQTRKEQQPYATILFALLKAGLTPNLASLARLPDRMLASTLRRAQARNWIPAVDNIDQIMANMRQPRATLLLENDPDLAALLALAGLIEKQQQRLLEHLLREEQLSEAAWKRLAAQDNIDARQLRRIRETIEMNALLGGDVRLLQGAQRAHKLQQPRDLARLNRSDWEKIIASELPDLPDTLPGRSQDDRVRQMATAVSQTIEAKYPTAAFASRLQEDKGPLRDTFVPFFAENPDFDFVDGSIRQQLAGKEGAAVEKQRDQLGRLESLFHIAPSFDRYDQVKALHESGFTSAAEIAQRSQSGFRKAAAPALGGTQAADQIYARAQHTAAYELAVTSKISDQVAALPLQAMPTAKKAPINGGDIPFDDLFGSTLLTACNHCQSALSPSAYLVDLLDFAGRASDSSGKTGLDYLRDRRPDIENLQLDCDNSDTVLPFIDLVLEILENIVAPTVGFAPQTNKETESLLAEPERLNFLAYEPLQSALFPWLLPFDLHTSLTRATLDQLGVPHHELLSTLYSGRPAPARRLASGAYLGLTAEQIGLVAKPADNQSFRAIWGFVKNQAATGLVNIEDLLARSGLEFELVSELLETQFVNPDGLKVIAEGGQLRNISAELLDRFYRLSRLNAWTPYTISELDLMLGILDLATSPDSGFISNLAALARLHEEAGFDIAAMANWWPAAGQPDRALFAAALGSTAEQLDQLESQSNVTLDAPVDAHALWALVEQINETGFTLSDLLDLLSPPDETSLFSTANTDALLLGLQEAQGALLATTAADSAPADLSQNLLDLTEEHLAAAWDIERSLLSSLLVETAGSQPGLAAILTNPDFAAEETLPAALTPRLLRLHKQALLFHKLALDPVDFTAIAATSPILDSLNIARLPAAVTDPAQPIERFLTLVDHQTLNTQRFTNGESLFACAQRYKNEVSDLAGLETALADDTNWASDDLNYLFSSGGIAWASLNDFYADQGLIRLYRALQLAEKLEMPIADIWEFTILSTNQHDELRAVLEAKYTAEKWLEVAKQIHDPLREKRRDALLAHIISQTPRFRDPLDVYTTYLIDVEMSACYETSRTKQANASLQQLVQRILLNLEGDLAYPPTAAIEWEWRKNYRVWEANRKLFIYPENWMEPELRDDKSEFFTELEAQLLQDEVREDTAENALINYARKLHDVSNLEIAALLKDDETGIIDIFSRTRDLPHSYYLYRRSANGSWGGWEKIDLDIEGDHLIPAVYNRRLHLFWPSFEERLDDKNEAYLNELARIESEISTSESEIRSLQQSIKDLETLEKEYAQLITYGIHYELIYDSYVDALTLAVGKLETEEGTLLDLRQDKEKLNLAYTFLEVSLAWSKQDSQGAWSAKKSSSEHINTIYDGDRYYSQAKDLVLESSLSATNELTITIMQRSHAAVNSELEAGAQPFLVLGAFNFDVCASALHADIDQGDALRSELVSSSSRENQRLGVYGQALTLSTLTDQSANQRLPLLNAHPGEPLTVMVQPHAADDDKLKVLGVENGRTFVALRSNNWLSPKLGTDLPGIKVKPRKSKDSGDKMVLDSERQLATPASAGTKSDNVFSHNAAQYAAVIKDDDPQSNRMQERTYASANPAMREADFLDSFASPDVTHTNVSLTPKLTNDYQYQFLTFYHPYSCLFITQLSRYGLDGLYRPDADSDDLDMQALVRQTTPDADPRYFDKQYDPAENVKEPHPQELIDFTWGQPYAVYNWELFFHAPLLIAVRLTQDQRFAEAQRWFHYIFDPTMPVGRKTAEYWRFRPFYLEQLEIESGDFQALQELAAEGAVAFNAQVAEWEANPFNPYAVARLRVVAFMRATVMKYLDNLLAWGDHLFRRDTMESLNEAMQIYVIAAQILGPKPVLLDALGESDNPPTAVEVLNGVSMLNAGLAYAAAGTSPTTVATAGGTSFLNTLLTFCLPPNDKLLGYWDTVADRLFKLRSCMNIEGIIRQLPLFEPPIDPALLVRAAAAGVSLQSAVASLSAPQPKYRFRYVLQKALEFNNDVKALGSTLLATLEKQDAEELALLRANHEVALQQAITQNKDLLLDDAKTNLEAATVRRELVYDRYKFYADRDRLNQNEKEQMGLLTASLALQYISSATNLAASIAYLFPQAHIGMSPKVEHGGLHVGQSISAWAGFAGSVSQTLSATAGMAANTAGYERRTEDWDFQADQAQTELDQIEKELISAELRIALAEVDQANHKLQIEQSEEAHLFLKDKFSSKELYSWMVGEISTLYFQAYQLAYDMAKSAEKAYAHELGLEDSSFIQYGYWDSLKKGLLAGEKLTLDLRRMETAYINNHVRERELTKHISLALLNPLALLQLKETGTCHVAIPEALFDLDFPGHYFRRIKSVSLTVPAVTGPYTTLGCTLTLESSQVRRTMDLAEPLVEESVAQYQSISTSSGQNDSGVFQLDFRDERYLPFEGAGAVSQWQLRLTNPDLAQFDYGTINDVLFHLNYTAREAADTTFQGAVEQSLLDNLNSLLGTGEVLSQLLTVRNHFPDEWSRLLAATGDNEHTLSLHIQPNFFPYLMSKRDIEIAGFDLLLTSATAELSAAGEITCISPDQASFGPAALEANSEMPGVISTSIPFESNSGTPTPKPLGIWQLTLSSELLVQLQAGHGTSIDDLILLCQYVIN